MSDYFQLLPLEIRRMSYVECLVVGKIFPYRKADRDNKPYDVLCAEEAYKFGLLNKLPDDEFLDYPAPQVQIFLVCRYIQWEAEPLVYQRNTVVLPSTDFAARFFERCLHDQARSALVTSVEVKFDISDFGFVEREQFADRHLQDLRVHLLLPETHGSELFSMNDLLNDQLHGDHTLVWHSDVWPREVVYLLDSLHLESLTLDFGNDLCASGVCDMRAWDILSFSKGFTMGVPKNLKLLGLGTVAEAAIKMMARWTLRRGQGSEVSREEDDILWEGIEEALFYDH